MWLTYIIGQYSSCRGEEPDSSERSGNEDNGDCTGEEVTRGGKAELAKPDAKHKRKKHKHRSKHRKHKHVSPEDKDRRHKHRHKHKKRKRKDSAKGDAVDSFLEAEKDISPSSLKRPRLDDLAVLEDLEKQRAMIQAELDNELMEGRVHSGMGLILQGYNSGSEDDGEFQERIRNGEPLRGQGGAHSGREAGRSRWDFTDEASFGFRRRSRSRSKDCEVKRHKDERRKSRSEAETDCRHQEKARRRSQERNSRSTDQSKERRISAEKVSQHSQSPEAQLMSSAVKIPPSPSTAPPGEQKSTQAKSGERRSRSRERRSRSRDRRAMLPESEKERDVDKKPGKSPTKETSSGKENRSPSCKQGPSPQHHSDSPRRREHHSPQRPDRRSTQSASAPRYRSPGRRGHSRSPERRRREGDRPRPSPVRYRQSSC